jgi:hypothetical protein
VEFGSSSELDRVVSARLSLHRTGSLARTGPFRECRVYLSWGSCSRRNAFTSGAPARPNGFEAVREDEGRQALAGAVLRVLAPLDGSSCARGTARALAELAVSPWRPDASRPSYMPLASLWSCPTELSLPEEPFLLSQAFASLRVRMRLPPARRDRALHGRFPRRASSLPETHPEASPDA